jgi:hypothetical protein
MIRPFAQNIWDLRPPVSVEFRGGQHEKAWTPPNTLSRILARVLQAETARMARCPSAGPKRHGHISPIVGRSTFDSPPDRHFENTSRFTSRDSFIAFRIVAQVAGRG